MSIFGRPASFEAAYSVHEGPDDDVRVGDELWAALRGQGMAGRVCVAVQPLSVARLPSLVAWASPSSQLPSSSISIPGSWRPSSSTLTLTPVAPQLLTSVILLATSPAALQLAQSGSPFEPWFEHSRILRAGETITVPGQHLTFKVDTVEPVLQGYIKKDLTRIVVLLAEEEDAAVPEAEDDDADIEIGESFLAAPSVASSFAPSRLNTTAASPSRLRPQDPLVLEPLLSPVSPATDDVAVYLRAPDLGRLGLLNSDWATLSSPSSPSKSRLVRVNVDDSLVASSGRTLASPILLHNIFSVPSSSSPPPVSVPSNSASSSSTASLVSYRAHHHADAPPNHITLTPTPFASHTPHIPTARSITVARIASPLSTSRIYQNSFLRGLKAYFSSNHPSANASKRLVKQGDLICVPVDGESARWQPQGNDGEEESGQPINLASAPPPPTGLVFFMITNVEYDVVSDHTSSSTTTASSSTTNNQQDVLLSARTGELGVFVDPDVTRIVQAGLERARVPDVGAYFPSDPSSPRSLLAYLSSASAPSPLLAPTSPFSKLHSLASASLSRVSLDCSLDTTFLLKGNRGTGKFTTVSWVGERLGVGLMEVNCYDLLGDTDSKTEATLRVRFDQAANCAPCILVLRKLEALVGTTQPGDGSKEPALTSVLKECIANLQTSWKMTSYPVLVVGIATDPSQVPPEILALFKHEVGIEVPDERTRHAILTALLRNETLASDVSISELATQTAALVAADLVDLVARSKALALDRVLKGREKEGTSIRLAGFDLLASDFENALGKARELYSESIGAPKIPTVSWDDVGGLAHVKHDILDTIQLPLEHPELFADGLKKRSGILLYGPPGTGKTLIAKAVATSCSLNFFSVKGPELLNMYIGESEANVRRIFQKARDAKPCVIFFDELDSIAPKRGNQGDSGGVMDRIVSQLLAELDGMSSSSGSGGGGDVFVIGATNRPDLLDPALLRPGRFDRMLYLGVSETHDAQLTILEALTRKFRLDAKLDLRDVAERCPFNYTGADFYALCSDAMLNAMSRKAMALEDTIAKLNQGPRDDKHPHPITPQYYLGEMATQEEILVTVNAQDFGLALEKLVPSVSQADMEHYAKVQKRFTQAKDIKQEDKGKGKGKGKGVATAEDWEEDEDGLTIRM